MLWKHQNQHEFKVLLLSGFPLFNLKLKKKKKNLFGIKSEPQQIMGDNIHFKQSMYILIYHIITLTDNTT